MASAFFRKDRQQWMADFRGYGCERGSKRQIIRVPAARIRSPATAAKDAARFADECETYARILEAVNTPQQAEDILHATRLGVITQAQADAMQQGRFVPSRSTGTKRLTIREAAEMHPSTHRDSLGKKVEYLRYLDQFITHSGVAELHSVTLDHVLSWVASMTRDGLSWDTRRHHLMYLRRAFVMGRRHGVPDQIGGLRIDHRTGKRTALRVWPLNYLIKIITNTEDPRIKTALALGGCLGLRPSEIIRAAVGDLQGDLLSVGTRQAKNQSSTRTLPVPAAALPWIRAAIGKRKTGPILTANGARSADHLGLSGLNQLLSEILRGPNEKTPIAPKDLRKTFATWAAKIISGQNVERYLGHTSALHSEITNRSYLAAHQAEELRPACALMDVAIREKTQ